VGIYGSRELFVEEYRSMLAGRLLENRNYDTDREVHTLELLKLRFGETDMRTCEIMVKDIDDSKRVVSNIRSTLSARQPDAEGRSPGSPPKSPPTPPGMILDAAILSHVFWPSLPRTKMRPHPSLKSHMDAFGREFYKLKNPRRLVWINGLGSVTLDLQLEGEEAARKYTVSPTQATLVAHFGDKDAWTSAELAEEMAWTEEGVRRAMALWIRNGVIKVVSSGGSSATTYRLATLEELRAKTSARMKISGVENDLKAQGSFSEEEDEDEEMMLAKGGLGDSSKAEEDLKTYESYVMGMLTNLGQLPLDRIQNMLKMFMSAGGTGGRKYDMNTQQLSSFLRTLCRQEKIEFVNHTYRLVKK